LARFGPVRLVSDKTPILPVTLEIR
jgi:hypothetical protein